MGWDRQRMREKIKYRSYQFLAKPEYGIPKKIAKKFKKLKIINVASFQTKTGQERLRMIETKILIPIHSNQTRNKAFQKKIAKKC